MDTFINLAKQGLESYTDSQSRHSPRSSHSSPNVTKMGGEEYNRPPQSQYESEGGRGAVPYVDKDNAIHHAEKHGSGDRSLFDTALGHLDKYTGSKRAEDDDDDDDVDDEKVTRAHKEAYEREDPSNLSPKSMGMAAAMQAFQMFSSGGAGSKGKGDSKSQLIGIAMSEASKLFDRGGGSAGKQEAVNSAATTVMKMLLKSKISSAVGGGSSSSGGLGDLMGLASKFL